MEDHEALSRLRLRLRCSSWAEDGEHATLLRARVPEVVAPSRHGLRCATFGAVHRRNSRCLQSQTSCRLHYFLVK